MKQNRTAAAHQVVVVDDHGMLRDGLTAGLNKHADIEVIGSAPNVAEFEASFGEWDANVVVADYNLPDGTGLDILGHVRSHSAETRVIIVTGHERVGLLRDVISAGGDGLLSKSVTISELASAVVAVGCGASAFPAGALRQWAERDLSEVGATLTPREREVLGLLATAKSATAIAHDLTVSTNTVRNHIRAILAKLQVSSQLEAVVTAQREGLV